MPADAAQQKKNLSTARAIIAQRQGVDPSNLTYEQRGPYNRALAEFIADRPADFSAASVAIAQKVIDRPAYEPLADESLDFSAAIPDLAGQVEKKLTLFVVVAIIAAAGFLLLPRGLAAARAQ